MTCCSESRNWRPESTATRRRLHLWVRPFVQSFVFCLPNAGLSTAIDAVLLANKLCSLNHSQLGACSSTVYLTRA
ncbi:hypothetical protein XA68_18487 [Ophiocordyceps unilateralis]|uniref:Uncharacterized protein n=1 Tax=Ophiocordyceps unilateralis TaxID=268505 RepID=A0A2A9PHY2_OPHUN|nr:hypothetical protein XA68_18487 [Ophiocordyceps unilateralis]